MAKKGFFGQAVDLAGGALKKGSDAVGGAIKKGADIAVPKNKDGTEKGAAKNYVTTESPAARGYADMIQDHKGVSPDAYRYINPDHPILYRTIPAGIAPSPNQYNFPGHHLPYNPDGTTMGNPTSYDTYGTGTHNWVKAGSPAAQGYADIIHSRAEKEGGYQSPSDEVVEQKYRGTNYLPEEELAKYGHEPQPIPAGVTTEPNRHNFPNHLLPNQPEPGAKNIMLSPATPDANAYADMLERQAREARQHAFYLNQRDREVKQSPAFQQGVAARENDRKWSVTKKDQYGNPTEYHNKPTEKENYPGYSSSDHGITDFYRVSPEHEATLKKLQLDPKVRLEPGYNFDEHRTNTYFGKYNDAGDGLQPGYTNRGGPYFTPAFPSTEWQQDSYTEKGVADALESTAAQLRIPDSPNHTFQAPLDNGMATGPNKYQMEAVNHQRQVEQHQQQSRDYADNHDYNDPRLQSQGPMDLTEGFGPSPAQEFYETDRHTEAKARADKVRARQGQVGPMQPRGGASGVLGNAVGMGRVEQIPTQEGGEMAFAGGGAGPQFQAQRPGATGTNVMQMPAPPNHKQSVMGTLAGIGIGAATGDWMPLASHVLGGLTGGGGGGQAQQQVQTSQTGSPNQTAGGTADKGVPGQQPVGEKPLSETTPAAPQVGQPQIPPQVYAAMMSSGMFGQAPGASLQGPPPMPPSFGVA